MSRQKAAAHIRAVIPRKFVRVSSRRRTTRDLLLFFVAQGAPLSLAGALGLLPASLSALPLRTGLFAGPCLSPRRDLSRRRYLRP